MNVVLVYPPVDAEVPAKSTLLGLGYLASSIRRNGHDVEIVDLTLSGKTTEVRMKKVPDVIGLSCMFSMYKNSCKDFAYQVKRLFPDTHLIIGGAHASTFPEEMMEYADTVVVGEGEEVINDIIENKKTGIFRTERIKNLDNLSFPAWDLMMEDVRQINELSKNSPFLMRRPLAHIITSRGCPNNCTFCAVKVAWGRQWIARSAENVVSEIEYLHGMGFNEIHFNDDNCSVDKNRMYRICEELLKSKVNVKIACPTGIHIGTLDRDLLKLMKRAGFYRLCFGIETGSPMMQMKIKKNINLDKARQVIKDANDLGYWTSATFIFGFPEETEKDVMDSLNFAKTSGLDFPIFYNLIMQPKTEIYEKYKSLL